ncbi:MAG: hypothetical protein CME26_05475 [Gemmatimonadetes bacterium]|nr:hypothetical protein [Gemmatimonadota bacterium]|tara:strand:+ start:11505 stop:13466 length:1962 start_codon:yes stop_codon:yes gene_type:complete
MALPQQDTHPEATTDIETQRAVTWKAVTIGLILVLAAALGGFYARHILHTTRLAQNHLSLAAVFPFFIVAVFLRRPLRINRGELLVVFSMGLIASTLPTYFLSRLISSLAVPHYLADPTNGWAEYTHEHLPTWAVIQPGPALTWFFEGLPRGESIPWDVWIWPLLWWFSLLGAVCLILFSTMVILRKQWIEYERLEFPLVEVPLVLVGREPEDRSFFPPLLRSSLFWLGFGFSAAGILWNVLGYFSHDLPKAPWRLSPISIGYGVSPIRMALYWPIVGFTYLIKLDVSFSIVFFFILAVAQEATYNRFGLKISEPNFAGTSFIPVGWQMMGVWIVVVGYGLWVARGHLGNVWRKAIHRDPTVDDSDELLSYRTAVLSFLGGNLFLGGWLYASGLELWVVGIFMPGMMVIYLGITRIIAETGVITIRAVMLPQVFTMFAFGTDVISTRTMAALGLSMGWHGDMKTTLMPAIAHSVKLFDTIKGQRRALAGAILAACGVGIAASIFYIIVMAYQTGAGNYGSQISGGLARGPWDFVVKYSRSPVPPDWRKLAFLGSGMGLTTMLYVLRARFPWWPFHPLGLAAGAAYPVTNVIFPIFIGWMCKFAILRFGGSRTYRGARPVFLGLIMGYYVAAGISFFVDWIWFPGDGHGIPFSD